MKELFFSIGKVWLCPLVGMAGKLSMDEMDLKTFIAIVTAICTGLVAYSTVRLNNTKRKALELELQNKKPTFRDLDND